MKLTSLTSLPREPVSHNPAIAKQVMLRSGDLPPLTHFSQARFSPGQVATAHHHSDMAEVFLVSSGQGTMYVNGQPLTLLPGTCVMVEPGETHEVINDGTGELVLTYFGLLVEGSVNATPRD